LGLAKVRRVAPDPQVVQGKGQMDLDTLRAVILSRMHVFARYGKEVMGPVSRAELCRDADHCRRLVRRARRLLLTEGKRLDAAARRSLDQLLARYQTLATVYQFRERLQEIWDRKAPSQDALLHALQDWCHQAEATGIQALAHFSRNLRGFALKPTAL
jgi:stearoyl-CoA desaturase (delta-9 desaturase)